MYQALYRKWRPLAFSDVVGQEHITETLRSQVASGRLSHAYLFTGTRGTGKTTCAKILARAVNCLHPQNGDPCNECEACRGILDGSILDVVEMDAASNNGVGDIRDLRDELVYTPASVKKRVYIIDEVHMLSGAAFNALLKTLEEPPEHVLFILATTEVHKVPATILSRCQRFSFKRISPEKIASRLLQVAENEDFTLTPEAAGLIARLGDGAMRDALSILDQCAAGGGTVDLDTAVSLLGLTGSTKVMELADAASAGNTQGVLESFSALYAEGKDVAALLDELCTLLRDILLYRVARGTALGAYDEAELSRLSHQFTPQRLLYGITVLQDSLAKLSRSVSPRIEAEVALLKLCDESLSDDVTALAARVGRLESQAASGVPLVAPAQAAPAPDRQPPERPSAPQPQAAAAPAAPAPAPTGGAPARGMDQWPEVLALLKGQVSPPEYTHLTLLEPSFGAEGLTLTAEDDFALMLLKGRNVEAKVAAAVESVTGAPCAVHLQKKSAQRGQGRDKLDDFAAGHLDLIKFTD